MKDIAAYRRERLRVCERTVAANQDGFRKAALALLEIRAADPVGWPAFCLARFGETDGWVDEVIDLMAAPKGGGR